MLINSVPFIFNCNKTKIVHVLNVTTVFIMHIDWDINHMARMMPKLIDVTLFKWQHYWAHKCICRTWVFRVRNEREGEWDHLILYYLDKGMIKCSPLSFVYLDIDTDLWYWFSTSAVTLQKSYFLHLLTCSTTCISRFHSLQFQVRHCIDLTCSG